MNAVRNIIFLIRTCVGYIGLIYIAREGEPETRTKERSVLEFLKIRRQRHRGWWLQTRSVREITFSNLRYKTIKQLSGWFLVRNHKPIKPYQPPLSTSFHVFFGWSFHVFLTHIQPSENPLDHFPEVLNLKHISLCFPQWSLINFPSKVRFFCFFATSVASVIMFCT